MIRRVVFDTNTVVSALLFEHGRLTWLRAAWRDGRFISVVCRETALELTTYPKFRLTQQERDELLGDYLALSETFEPGTDSDEIPLCPHERTRW